MVDKKKPTFAEKMQSDIAKRGAYGQLQEQKLASGQQGLVGTRFKQIGNVGAGIVNDAMGNALSSGFEMLPEPAKNAASKAGQFIMQSPVGTGIESAANAYGEFAKNHPELADYLNAGANLVSAMPSTKLGAALTSSVGKTAGDALVNSAENTIKERAKKFASALVSPRETPTNIEKQMPRAKEVGLLRTRVIEPSARDVSMTDAAAALPIKQGRSLTYNANVLRTGISDEAKKLAAALDNSPVQIDPNNILNTLQTAKQELQKNIYITGDASKESTVNRVIDGALEKITNNPLTPSGMLKARQDFDQWVQSQKGGNIFDPSKDSAASEAIAQVRRGINQVVSDSVPDIGVKESLANQSNLYRALENVDNKAAYESPNMFGRFADKVKGGVNVKNATMGAAGLAGVGGLGLVGGASVVAPVLGTAAALYGAGKVAASPALRKGIGNTLGGIGKALNVGDATILDKMGGLGSAALNAPNVMSGIQQQPPNNMSELPEGFTLLPEPQNSQELPEGFTLLPDAQSSAAQPNLMDRMAQVESGGNPNAKASTSSASGLYQFTDQTWNDMVNKYGAQTGITPDMKADPQAQRVMAELLAQDNANIVQKQTGQHVDDGRVYLAHFMGAPAASKLINSLGTGASAAQLFPSAAKANQNIFFDKSGRPRTVEQVYQVVTSKVEGA
jgi:hypothetical protein